MKPIVFIVEGPREKLCETMLSWDRVQILSVKVVSLVQPFNCLKVCKFEKLQTLPLFQLFLKGPYERPPPQVFSLSASSYIKILGGHQ